MTTTPAIERYFELAHADADSYLAQFTPDAVVEDEGHEHHGIDAIRRWRGGVPQVTHDVQSIAATRRGRTAVVEISGAFPGSPVTLHFYAEEAPDGRIAVLRIRG